MPRYSVRQVVRWSALSVVAVAVLAHVSGLDGNDATLVYLAIVCGAAVAAWFGALRTSRWRASGVLLAAGVTLSALGDLVWAVYGWLWDEYPEVSLADVPWMGSYLAVGAAMVALLREERAHRRDIDGLIDTAVMGVVSFLVVWQFWVEPTLSDPAMSVRDRSVLAAYPILDAALVALAGRVVTSTSSSRRTGSGMLVAGVGCWLGSDLGFLILGSESSFGRWLDAGWMPAGCSEQHSSPAPCGVRAPRRLTTSPHLRHPTSCVRSARFGSCSGSHP